MSLKAAVIVPHPPLLIPRIGKENRDRLSDTIRAYDKLKQELIDNAVDTILIISPHGQIESDIFTINQALEYRANFEEFGDFATTRHWDPNMILAQEIREACELSNELHLITENRLDHGSSVPLFELLDESSPVRITPLYYSGLDLEAHFDLGKKIGRVIKLLDFNVAVIASGDLSHRLSKDAPAGYSPRGAKFDNKLIELLKNKKSDEIPKLPSDLIKDAQECGLKSILILLGILAEREHIPQVLSYEYPFGVGYLTMNFALK